jgi:hypothetical protein
MKLALLTSLIAGSAAFAPSLNKAPVTALGAKEDYAGEVGVVAPLGLWDPMNVLGKDSTDAAEFDRLRGLEIKHGRVAMLGVVGYLVTAAGIRIPGLEDVPCGFAAWDALPGTVAQQMGITLIFMEMANRDQTGGKAEFNGDFRNGALDFGWDKQTDDWKKKKRTIELNNGRAAQMGIVGLMVHESMGNLGDILYLP